MCILAPARPLSRSPSLPLTQLGVRYLGCVHRALGMMTGVSNRGEPGSTLQVAVPTLPLSAVRVSARVWTRLS